MIIQPGIYAILESDLATVRRIDTYAVETSVKDGRAKPVAMTAQPPFNAATEKVIQNSWTVNANDVTPVWEVIPLTQDELDAIADAAEREAVKATRQQIGSDIYESQTDQAQAQAFIDIPAPTNAQRNEEVLNSAKRDKAAEQRYRRLARAIRSLLKDH